MALSQEELDILGSFTSEPEAPETTPLDRAMGANPDRSAKVLNIANSRDLPPGFVDENLDELEQRERADAIDQSKFGPRLMELINHPDKAAAVHDDLDNLRETEEVLRKGSIGAQLDEIGRYAKGTFGSLAGGIFDLEAGATGMTEALIDSLNYTAEKLTGIDMSGTPLDKVSEALGGHRQRSKAFADSMMLETDSQAVKDILGGVRSAGANIVSMVPAAAAGKASYTLGTMIGSVFGSEYGGATDEGLSVPTALTKAAIDAIIEYATEKNPASKLIEDLGIGKSFLKTMGYQQIAEGVGEQAATALQDLNAWAYLPENKDKSFADYLRERPSAALSTMISTIVGTGVQTGVTYGTTKLIDRVTQDPTTDAIQRRTEQLLQAHGDQADIDRLIILAQASKTNERAADLYKEFLSGAGTDKKIYVPVDILNDLDLTNLPESILDQIDGLGADIEIPMEQFMSEIATNPENIEALRPHIRMGERSLSATEIEKGGDATVKAMLERAQKHADIKTEADDIWEDVKDQLTATRTMSSSEARIAAQLYPAYATVAAARYGISVKQVYERMNFTVTGPTAVEPDISPADVEEGGVTPETVAIFSDDVQSVERPAIPPEKLAEKAEQLKPAEDRRSAETVDEVDSAIAGDQPTLSRRRAESRRRDEGRRAKIEAMTLEEKYDAIYRHELSGLNNRRAFKEDIDASPVVISIDMDSLKAANDYLGPDAGDDLLVLAGRILQDATGGNAYHISGDEFYVLGKNREELETAVIQAQKAMEAGHVKSHKGELKGLSFTYGVAGDKVAADDAMKAEKASREEAGMRVARGEIPEGMELYQQGVSQLEKRLTVVEQLRDCLNQ